MAGVVRLFHKRGSNGERIVALDDKSFRVWHQYVLSADDYGVMRASAAVLMADNRRLEKWGLKRVEAEMAAVLASTLVAAFDHQGARYWWQLDWQDFQGVDYPKDTILPAPPPDVLAKATPATQMLFSVHDLPSNERHKILREAKKLRKSSREIPATIHENSGIIHARARGPEIQTHTQTQIDPGSAESEEIPISTDSPAWRQRGQSPAGALVGSHRRCVAVAAAACARGVCVPAFMVTQWLTQLRADASVPNADATVRAFVTDTLDDVAGPIGDDPLDFWRAAWLSAYGSKAPRRQGRGPLTGTRAMVDWHSECEQLHGGRCGSATFHAAQLDADREGRQPA